MNRLTSFSTGSIGHAYHSHRRGITRALYTTLLASFGIRIYRSVFSEKKDKSLKPRVAVNATFLRNLLRLLRVAFPSPFTKDTLLVLLQAAALIIRTYLSLYIARLDGLITVLLTRGEGAKFVRAVALWMAIGVPAATINAVIQFLMRRIALRIRTRLTDHALDRYLVQGHQQPVYYGIQQHDSVNVGQIMAADIAKFSSSLAKLYSNLAKPILDVSVYTYQLSKSIGGDNVFLLGLTIQLSAHALRLAAPPFGEFVATEAKLEGDYRAAHSRLVEYAEEVAFYDGHIPERRRLDTRFYALAKHVDRVLRHRLAYASLEDFVVKYWWGAAGLVLCSIPVFNDSSDSRHRAQNFVVNRKLLLLSSDAVGRIMSSYKEISSLAGMTARVTEFFDEITTLAGGSPSPNRIEAVESEVSAKDRIVELGDSEDEKSVSSQLESGRVMTGDRIEFDQVPIVSPTGETLVKDLSFRIDQGHHLLIVGPNGSGKSSLFRILGGLWPVTAGRVIRPKHNEMFYIPQRPYLSHGSLRQQIIYPISEKENTVSDAELNQILEVLGLQHLVESVGGWDAVREWREDLSMGAQQKIAAARLFYHRPKFAILDECTASVTLDTETTIYTHAQELGISLLTVSHRASLWQYHDKILQFDGQGHYLFADLNPSERLALEEEKLKIDYQLRQVEQLKERLSALEQQKLHRPSDASVC